MRSAAVLIAALAATSSASATSAPHVRSRRAGAPTGALTRPSQYTAAFTMTLPYVDLVVPRVTKVDLTNERLRLTDFSGLFDVLYLHGSGEGKDYQSYVASSERKCLVSDDTGGVESMSMIPDPTRFTYVGTGPCPQPAPKAGAHVVETAVKGEFEKEDYLGRIQAYRRRILGDSALCDRYEDAYWEGPHHYARVEYSVAAGSSVPVQVQWHGHCNFTGSHRDTYVLDATDFKASVNETDFAPPSGCSAAAEAKSTMGTPSRDPPVVNHVAEALAKMNPRGSAARKAHELTNFMLKHQKNYKSADERAMRANVLAKNMDMIYHHNLDASKTYKMAINHLGDHTPGEYKAHATGCHQASDPKLILANVVRPETLLKESELPTYVDWEEQGAVSRTKDQSACGSCWSFAAATALETANFRATGKMTVLSEQNLVDCAWPNNTNDGTGGCGGSDALVAWQWLLDNRDGRLATAASYPYTGVDGYCLPESSTETSPTRLTGYSTCAQGDAVCAKNLISKYGSAAIAIDASHPSFGFYAGGTYYEPACGNTLNDLDHAVTAIGYGTDEDGEPYLLVRNSWSNYWASGSVNGNGGANAVGGNIRMSMRNNNCGVLTELGVPHVTSN